MANFRALKALAGVEKEYRFNQGKSERLAPSAPGGYCLSLSLMWIKEKLNNPRKIGFGARNSEFSYQKGIDPRDHHATHQYNAGLYLRGVYHEATYRQNTDPDDLSSIEQSVGLNPSIGSLNTIISSQLGVAVDLVATMDQGIRNLQKGQAALVQLQFTKNNGSRGAHAVAMYKSRAGSLYFFDANAGIYLIQVTVREFFRTWERCYAQRAGWNNLVAKDESFGLRNFSHIYSR